MKKITISLALSLGLFGTFAFASFTDVSEDDEHGTAIQYLQDQAIVGGYDDGSFRSENTVNRAEFTKIIVEAVHDDIDLEDTSLDGLEFSDIAEGEWYIPYLKIAVEEGMISGYPDGTYKPADNVNFVEASKIIAEGFGAEVSEEALWYEPYVEELEDWAAIPFDIQNLESEVTRGQMAEMIYRIHSGEDSLPSSGLDVLSGTQQYWSYDEETYEALLGNRAVTLYFHADWCPTCVALESYIVTNMDSFPEGSIFLEVDYDEYVDLRSEYDVTYQFTFIVLNGEGELVEKLTTNNVAYVREAMEQSLGL